MTYSIERRAHSDRFWTRGKYAPDCHKHVFGFTLPRERTRFSVSRICTGRDRKRNVLRLVHIICAVHGVIVISGLSSRSGVRNMLKIVYAHDSGLQFTIIQHRINNRLLSECQINERLNFYVPRFYAFSDYMFCQSDADNINTLYTYITRFHFIHILPSASGRFA